MAKRLVGTSKVLNDLNKKVKHIEGRTMKGLIQAVIEIRRDMDKTPPLIPVDTNNLRGSFFTDPFYQRGNPVIRLGFTANYAWFVHENVGANFQRPGAGSKFFEASIKRNKDKVTEIIAREARK